MNKRGLHVQMFSIHGLVRFNNPELGRDADTGGQVLYVVELAKHLSQREDIRRIDLFTRQIEDPRVSDDYASPVETFNDKCRIVRIRCGGRKYLRKELLWPHLDEYVDKTIKFINRESEYPDVVHGHYPDGGYVAMNLSHIFGLPFIFTGHSMGIPKKRKLLDDGMSEADIIRKYKIDTRIGVEEQVLKSADLIITSTRQEIDEQYAHYTNSDFPDYRIIPPGIDVDRFHPFYYSRLAEEEKPEAEKYAKASLLKQLERFFTFPDKPLILALSRPDKRKNITGLIKAYGEDKELQALANLAVFAGIRKNIDTMEENEKDVLTRMLLDMDRYDLYGKLAIPKKHDVEYEVPELYRIAAEKHGVFINPALTEPFGLTLLEAAASGLPLVATNDGGPSDIIGYCRNGILIDATDNSQISSAIKKILTNDELWEEYSRNGIMNVRKHFTWESHAESYMENIKPLSEALTMTALKRGRPVTAIGKRLTRLDRFFITAMDDTLIGETAEGASILNEWLTEKHESVAFGVAGRRCAASIAEILRGHGFIFPDVIISSLGTEIYYGKDLHYDKGWETHIVNRWEPEKIRKLLGGIGFLEPLDQKEQCKYMVSYAMAPGKDRIPLVHDTLIRGKCRYSLFYSHDRFLDIIPYRASQGKAIRYLSYKWETPLSHFLVCGCPGIDIEMMRGEPLGVVVGNHSGDLKERLKNSKNFYFARESNSDGVIEGIRKYLFAE